MKILFDHQIYVEQNYGGISRYFYELSKGLPLLNIDIENTITVSSNIYTQHQPYNSNFFLPKKHFKGKTYLLKRVNEFFSNRKINQNTYDILHPTYYDTYFLNYLKKPFVITFHDLIHEKFALRYPSLSADKTITSRRKLLLEKSTKIITVSQSTKNDVVNFYNVSPSKIEVVYLANSINADAKDTAVSFGDYILYVGNRADYKNFESFITAIAPLLIKEKYLKVVCAGGGAFKSNEIFLFNKHNLSNQLIQINIDDTTLASLYKKALFFVFPSLYEGFGLPVLEAFSCACPAVISNTSSLPEVGGDAALYFNPNDESDMLDKVSQLLYDTSLRMQLSAAGLKREKEFAWYKTVERHGEVYKSALQ